MDNDRNEALRVYLRAVAKDLILRGIIRKQSGQSFIEVLRQEPSTVLGTFIRDLGDAGFSVGTEIVNGAVSSLLNILRGHK